MKKLSFLFILSIFTLISVSCEEDEPEQNDIQPGAFVAIIDGVTIDFLYQPRAYIGTCNSTPCMFLDGKISDFSKELNISIENLTSTGTYVIGGTSNNLGYYSTSPPGGGEVTSYGSSDVGGSLTVTSYEGNDIKGNFSFEAVKINDSSVIITISGTFDLAVSE